MICRQHLVHNRTLPTLSWIPSSKLVGNQHTSGRKSLSNAILHYVRLFYITKFKLLQNYLKPSILLSDSDIRYIYIYLIQFFETKDTIMNVREFKWPQVVSYGHTGTLAKGRYTKHSVPAHSFKNQAKFLQCVWLP